MKKESFFLSCAPRAQNCKSVHVFRKVQSFRVESEHSFKRKKENGETASLFFVFIFPPKKTFFYEGIFFFF